MFAEIVNTNMLDKQRVLQISILQQHQSNDMYIKRLRKVLAAFDEQYLYTYNLYKDSPCLENKLEEIVCTNNSNIPQNNENVAAEIKRQVDAIFNKYLPFTNDYVSENTDGLDLELMDKITPLVPEGKEILLKNIVKELNGSAKGLSDFVIIFTKYRQAIINHNGIEYFQRKGCHFLRKI